MTDLLERLKAAMADRYAIEQEIGSGGMATVYLAEDLKHHRRVAVNRSDRGGAAGHGAAAGGERCGSRPRRRVEPGAGLRPAGIRE